MLLKWLEQADRFDTPLVEHFGDEVGEDFALFRWCWTGLKSVADGSEILDRRRFSGRRRRKSGKA